MTNLRNVVREYEGIEFIEMSTPRPDIVVFMDGDYSDHADEMKLLVDPIINEGLDFVVGSRMLGDREKGSVTPQQVIGNKIASFLLKVIYKINCTDLGPFRAIRYTSLKDLKISTTILVPPIAKLCPIN